MSQTPSCLKCGKQLPDDAPAGLCPKCLVQAGFESEIPRQEDVAGTVASPPSAGFQPPAAEALAKRFPQLEIIELLGKGGMGAVYRARQPGLDRLVAVKILPAEISNDPTFAERFTREARALARLSHPNIVAVYDFGQADGLYFFVMEYVDGINLRQAIQAGGITSQKALAIVPQICEALQFAHDEGIVHRDIKPENILIDKRGRVKIADFGLAKLLGHDASDHSLTATHQVMGTQRYMAPEQMQGSREVDHRADIYSLGVVFYELLTGEVPMGRFAPPSKKAQVDLRLDEIVLRALEQEPEQRYQHASDIKSDVENVASKPAPTVAPTAPLPREVINDAANTKPAQLIPLPRFFWLLWFGTFTVGWITVAALWNFGLTGFVLGSVVMAAITLQIGRSHENRNPLWVEKICMRSAAKRFSTLFFNLSVLAILFMLFIGGLFLIWDSAEKRANPFAPTSDAFEAQYKGKEYQLIRRLGAFKDQVPAVELSKDPMGMTIADNISPPVGWLFVIGDLLLLFFFFQQSAGAQAHLVKGLRRGGWRTAFASTGIFLSSVVCASIPLVSLPLLPVNDAAKTTVNNTIVVHAQVNQVSNALRRWTAENGCESASNRWSLQAVSKGERVASVEVFDAWKESPFERWQMTASGLERPFPNIAVQIIGSLKPVQSEVMMFSGGYPFGMVVVGSDKEKQWQAIIKNLSDAVSKAPDLDPNSMSIAKPAIEHAEKGPVWPGLCGVLAAAVLWVFVTVRYLTPMPASQAALIEEQAANKRESRFPAWLIASCILGILGCAWPCAIVTHGFFAWNNQSETNNHGVYVVDLFGDSPATKAGVRTRDTISSFAGQQAHLNGADDPNSIWKKTPVGADVEIKVERYGKEIVLHTVRSPDPIVTRLHGLWQVIVGLALTLFVIFVLIGKPFPRAAQLRGVAAILLGLATLVLMLFYQHELADPMAVVWGHMPIGSDWEWVDFGPKLTVCTAALALLLVGAFDIRQFFSQQTSNTVD